MRCSPAALLIAVPLAAACGGGSSTTTPTSSSPPATETRAVVSIAAGGIVLGGILLRPATAGPHPAIVVLHGWQPAGTDGAALVEGRARRFANDGYVALALSLRGWPRSGGSDDCGLQQPDDVAAAVAWLRSQPGVIGDRIGIVGFSQGGQVALLTATRDRQLPAVVAYFPVTDVAAWKTTTANADIPGYITAVCEPGGTAPRSPLTHASEIGSAVLLVHGDADTRVPTDQSVRLQAALQAAGRTSTLVLVPGAQHGFTPAEDAVAQPLVDAFLAARLK